MVLDADYGEIMHVEPIAESEYIDDLIDETIHQMHIHLHDYTENGKILPYTPSDKLSERILHSIKILNETIETYNNNPKKRLDIIHKLTSLLIY